MLAEQSDGDLAALGSRESFSVLFQRHRTPVYQFIARQVADRALAEDVFQVVFLKAFRALASYRGDAGFRTWLFSIAVHAIADERRKSRTAVALPEDLMAAPRPSAETGEVTAMVRRAIGDLPEKHRRLFLLVRYHGMRIAEAAAAVGLTPGSAKVTLFRIQSTIGSQLKSLGALL